MNCWNNRLHGQSAATPALVGRPTTITYVSKGEVSLKRKT
nr:MAG TPA: hypothetical protein [Caudoviricetes sp.]